MLDDLKVTTDIRDAISFFSKDGITCPACETDIEYEVMRMGAGRLDAGKLDVDLHRNYLHTEEHGDVYPLLYQVITCPQCYYTAMKFDFDKLTTGTKKKISQPTEKARRVRLVQSLLHHTPDPKKKKDLISGVAAYLMAMSTYESYNHLDSPTIRMAICALRAAWLCKDIRENSDMVSSGEIDLLVNILYRKAFFLYDKAIDLSVTGEEDVTRAPVLGPDFDKDYGYDGVIYIHAWLYVNYDMLIDNGVDHKKIMLRKMKTNLSKVFGFGKASKIKPSSLMDAARVTYDQVDEELKKLDVDV